MNIFARQFTDSSIARWFRTLSKREQVLVFIVLVLVGLVLSYVLYANVHNFRDEKVAEYQSQLADLEWMKANVSQAKLKARLSSASERGDWSPIYRNAELHQISIQRIQPGSDGAAIELEAQAFQDVLNWIFALQEDAGLRIEQVRLTKTDEPGMVTTSLVIQ